MMQVITILSTLFALGTAPVGAQQAAHPEALALELRSSVGSLILGEPWLAHLEVSNPTSSPARVRRELSDHVRIEVRAAGVGSFEGVRSWRGYPSMRRRFSGYESLSPGQSYRAPGRLLLVGETSAELLFPSVGEYEVRVRLNDSDAGRRFTLLSPPIRVRVDPPAPLERAALAGLAGRGAREVLEGRWLARYEAGLSQLEALVEAHPDSRYAAYAHHRLGQYRWDRYRNQLEPDPALRARAIELLELSARQAPSAAFADLVRADIPR